MATRPARNPLVIKPASHVLLEVSPEKCSQTRRAGSERGIGGDATNPVKIHRRKRAAGIESIPAKPEQQSARKRDGQVVRQHGSAAIAFEGSSQTRPKHDGAGESDEATDRVNDCRSCEIVESHAERGKEMSIASHSREPAVGTPGPVADDGINETGDCNTIKKVTDKSRCGRSWRRR